MLQRVGYKGQWVQTRTRRPGESEKGNRDGSRNYFFRLRTEVDEEGNIIKANYAKIYGDFPYFTYYFNPEVNDTNLEFDPKKNLFTNLKSLEKVYNP